MAGMVAFSSSAVGRVETRKSMRAMASRRVPGAERSIRRRSSGERAPRISSREGPSAIAWAILNPAEASVCASAWRSAMTLAGRTTGVAPGVMAFGVPSAAVVARPRENASRASAVA